MSTSTFLIMVHKCNKQLVDVATCVCKLLASVLDYLRTTAHLLFPVDNPLAKHCTNDRYITILSAVDLHSSLAYLSVTYPLPTTGWMKIAYKAFGCQATTNGLCSTWTAGHTTIVNTASHARNFAIATTLNLPRPHIKHTHTRSYM